MRIRQVEAYVVLTGSVVLCSLTLFTFAAQPSGPPHFEVSTVKPSGPDSGDSGGIDEEYGRVDARNVTLKRCIIGAYEIGPQQVIGGPDWVDSERFDIQAKADQPINDDHVLDIMLQTLLTDRFKLVMHRESRMVAAYVLGVNKSGAKMKQSPDAVSYTNTNSTGHGRVLLEAKNTNMDLLARVLSRQLDLPVVNQTGLKGAYDLKLQWTDIAATSTSTSDDMSIFSAVQEQLGLRLRKTKMPIEVFVIDKAERPTAN